MTVLATIPCPECGRKIPKAEKNLITEVRRHWHVEPRNLAKLKNDLAIKRAKVLLGAISNPGADVRIALGLPEPEVTTA